MKLLTKELQEKLPRLRDTEDVPCEDKILQVKFFHPMSNWTWYGVEYDPDERLFWGLVDGDFVEWGYFSLAELESVRVIGLGVERDLYFRPCKVGDLTLRGQ